MEENIIMLSVITLITYFVVANPYTYAVVSKVSGLKLKNKTHHMILVGIHSVVMTVLMYVAYTMLIKDKECPPPPACPPPPPVPECPVCDGDKPADQQQPPADQQQPPADQQQPPADQQQPPADQQQPPADQPPADQQQPSSELLGSANANVIEPFSF
jgi:hypothetical protein